jgi:hypothetical protein
MIRIENPIVIKPTRPGVSSLGGKYLTNYRIRLPFTPQEGLHLEMPVAKIFRAKQREVSNTDGGLHDGRPSFGTIRDARGELQVAS